MRKPYLLLLLFLLCTWLAGQQVTATHSDTLPESLKQRGKEAASPEAFETARTVKPLGPYHIVVPPAAFTSDGAGPDAFRIDADYGYLHGMYAPTNLWAPLYLPRDAVITALEVRLEDWDDRPDHDVCVYLDRMNLETGEYECCMIEICSYGGGQGYVTLVDNTIDNPVVSDLFAYQLNIYGLYPDTYIYGLRVGYGFSDHLPAVLNDYP